MHTFSPLNGNIYLIVKILTLLLAVLLCLMISMPVAV